MNVHIYFPIAITGSNERITFFFFSGFVSTYQQVLVKGGEIIKLLL